jgi:hypothetical protein
VDRPVRSDPPERGKRPLRLARAVGAAIAIALAGPASGQVFKCVDGAGRVTYQQSPCPAGAKGGPANIVIDNGAPRGGSDNEAQWEAAAQEHTVVVGMPKRFVQKSIGTARDIRPGLPGESAGEVWSYPRETETLRIGFNSGAVAWQRSDPAAGESPSPVEARSAALAGLMPGVECKQMLSDIGNADRVESGPPGNGESARRYVFETPRAREKTRTSVLCVNGMVQTIDRQPL